MTRLQSANEDLARLFFASSIKKQREAVRQAIGWVQRDNQLEAEGDLEQFLSKSPSEEQRARFGSHCLALSERFDNLYFEQEEAGMPEEIWGSSFHKSRIYAAIAAFCSSDENLHEALYEALNSADDNSQLLPLVKAWLTVPE